MISHIMSNLLATQCYRWRLPAGKQSISWSLSRKQ